jgi:hypothetical protein
MVLVAAKGHNQCQRIHGVSCGDNNGRMRITHLCSGQICAAKAFRDCVVWITAKDCAGEGVYCKKKVEGILKYYLVTLR